MSDDLNGSAPHESSVALLLIDVINDLEFDEGDALLKFAEPMAEAIADLKRRAAAANVPVVYVNDNFGQWRSDFTATVRHCLEDGVRGESIVRCLRPGEQDYFVLKPMHSGFYSSTLEVLLQHLGAKTLVLTGLAGNICVLFTANDAYMRDYKLFVPRDCVASNSRQLNDAALETMKNLLKADTRPQAEIDFAALVEE